MNNNTKKKRKNMNLTSKLALVYILAGFLPVLIILAVNFFEMRSMFSDEEKKKNEVYLKQTVDYLDSEFEEYNEMAEFFVEDDEMLKCLSAGNAGTEEFYKKIQETVLPAIKLYSCINSGVNSMVIYLDRDIDDRLENLAPISEIENCEWYDNAINNYIPNWYID